MTDNELLAEFARTESESAFATLVFRHVNLVYSAALRFTRNPHHAEEITQAVFTILARKARHLGKNVVLSGWFYQTARLTSANFLKSEIRRQRREQEAYMQSTLNDSDSKSWEQIAPWLDEAMGKLGETDRNAIVLRFFENKSGLEVATALKMNEAAAHKRLSRALEKLRKFFVKRGVVSTTAIIAGVVSANSVQAAPVALATSVSAAAITKGAAVTGSTLTLVKGALKIMAWTKAKTAIVVGAGVLLAAGTATVAVKSMETHSGEEDSWRVRNFDSRVLDRAAPQVKILPAKYSNGGGYGSTGGSAWMGLGTSVQAIISTAYNHNLARTIFPPGMPRETYDFIAKLPKGSRPQDVSAALQQEIRNTLGYTARREKRETDMLILRTRAGTSPKLIPSDPSERSSSGRSEAGKIVCLNAPVRTLSRYLESYFQIPVRDQTGITGNYDIQLKWAETNGNHKNLEGLKQAVLDQLGLELVPARQPIEMLIVEKVR